MDQSSKILPPGLMSARTVSGMPWMTNPQSKTGSRKRILVIDSDSKIHELIGSVLDDVHLELFSTLSADEAISRLQMNPEDIESLHSVYFCLTIPVSRGLQLFTRLKEMVGDLPIYVMAAGEALQAAKTAQQNGAASILLKPFGAGEVLPLIEGSQTQIKEQTQSPQVGVTRKQDAFVRLVGQKTGLQKVVSTIQKVAPSDVNVLITGEPGSGKETVAKAIHLASQRAGKPFIVINCASIPKETIEVELFGQVRAGIAGTSGTSHGLIEDAHEGTLLLDDVSELPLAVQAKLLRFMQTKHLKATGAITTRELNVRILASTTKNLKTLIQKGEFREDLYARLNVITIQVPSLRERREDIALLAEHFVGKCKLSIGKEINGITRAAITKMQAMPWSGNVRELENTIERAVVLAEGQRIDADDIVVDEIEAPPATAQIDDLYANSYSLKDLEREYIKYVLRKTGNRKEAATRILGIDRKTLYRKEKLYGLKATTQN